MMIAYYSFLVILCAYCTFHHLGKKKKDFFWISYGIFATVWQCYYLSEHIYNAL